MFLSFYKHKIENFSGVATKTEEQEIPNPTGTIINSTSVYGGNGISGVLNYEEHKKLEETIKEMVKEQESYWQKWTSDFYANMKKQFPPGFPFN